MERKKHQVGTRQQVGTSVPTYPQVGTQQVGTRIAEIADLFGERKIAAQFMGVDADTLRRWISGESKAPFLPLARLCLAVGRSLDWLAIGEDDGQASLPASVETHEQSADYITNEVDQGILARALETVEEALALAGKEVGIERKAGIVAAVYGALARPGGAADHAEIMRLIRSMLG